VISSDKADQTRVSMITDLHDFRHVSRSLRPHLHHQLPDLCRCRLFVRTRSCRELWRWCIVKGGSHPHSYQEQTGLRRCVPDTLGFRYVTDHLSGHDVEYQDNQDLLAMICRYTLCSPQHSHRFGVIDNLVIALWECFSKQGDVAFSDACDELMIELGSLRVHYACAIPGMRRAMKLDAQLGQTGNVALLDEAVRLHRKALASRPPGHPARAILCTNLASSLSHRFQQTEDNLLMDECIRLQREALSLHTECTSIDCASRIKLNLRLADFLGTRFQYGGHSNLMDEALIIQRDIIASRPAGHPERSSIFCKLSIYLGHQYDRTGNRAILNEAVYQAREALSLAREASSPALVSRCCTSLALLLAKWNFKKCNKCSGNIYCTQRDSEIMELTNEALDLTPLRDPQRWARLRLFCGFAVHFQHQHPLIIEYLNEALSAPGCATPALIDWSISMFRRIDIDHIPQTSHQPLLRAYNTAMNLISLATAIACDYSSQLQRLAMIGALASHAVVLASRVGDIRRGLQLLEGARGVIWSQRLHMRTPQLEHVPEELGDEFRGVLADVNDQSSLRHKHAMSAVYFSSLIGQRELNYELRSRLQSVTNKIRGLPGLDDFMRGPDADLLMTAAARNPVVILVADKKDCRALIIESPEVPVYDILLDGIDVTALQTMPFSHPPQQKRGSGDDVQDSARLALNVSTRSPPIYAALSKLWQTTVKPILSHLRLLVCTFSNVEI
jgi:hypothetical protein